MKNIEKSCLMHQNIIFADMSILRSPESKIGMVCVYRLSVCMYSALQDKRVDRF